MPRPSLEPARKGGQEVSNIPIYTAPASGCCHAMHDLDPVFDAFSRTPEPEAKVRNACTLYVIDTQSHYPAGNWLQRSADMPLRGSGA